MHSWQCKTWHLEQWEKQLSLHLSLCSTLLQALQTNSPAKIQGGASPHQKEGDKLALELSPLATGTIQSPWSWKLLTADLCFSLEVSV